MTEITTSQASYLTDLRSRFDVARLRELRAIHLEVGRPESSADPRAAQLTADTRYFSVISLTRVGADPRYAEALDSGMPIVERKALVEQIRGERYESLMWALTAEITTKEDASKAIGILK